MCNTNAEGEGEVVVEFTAIEHIRFHFFSRPCHVRSQFGYVFNLGDSLFGRILNGRFTSKLIPEILLLPYNPHKHMLSVQ